MFRSSVLSLPVGNAERPLGYRKVAALLRDEIRSGRLRPGDPLPSERQIPQIYGVAIETGKRAVRLLQQEGLVVVRHGHPTRVAASMELTEVRHQRLTQISSRPPTAEEREAHGDTWMLDATLFGKLVGTYPASRYFITIH